MENMDFTVYVIESSQWEHITNSLMVEIGSEEFVQLAIECST
jgi:hypothetical protein